MKRIINKKRSGFSLLEVLVALGITAVVLALVSGSLVVALRAQSRAMEHMDQVQILRESLNSMSQYIGASALSRFRPEFTPFESFDESTMSEPFDAITFTTLAYRTHKPNAPESDFMAMTYFTVDDNLGIGPEGTKVLMHRIGGVINDRFEVEGGIVYPLLYGVSRFELDYLEPEGEWRHEWLLADRFITLPCAVRVILGIKTFTLGEIQTSTIIPLVMTNNRCVFERDTVLREYE